MTLVPPSVLLATVCMLVVVLTASAFALVVYRGRSATKGTSATLNSPMIRAAFLTVVSSFGFLIPELLRPGRTALECVLLQHFLATSTILTVWLVLNFYIIRSSQLSQPSRLNVLLLCAAVAVGLALFLYNLYAINRDMITFVDDSDLCISRVNNWTTGLYGFVLPCLFEAVVAVRFVVIVRAFVSVAQSSSDASPLYRMLFVTCAVQLSSLVGDAFVILVLMGALPVSHPRLMGMMISAQCTYKACSVAWPIIIIDMLKWRKHRHSVHPSAGGVRLSAPIIRGVRSSAPSRVIPGDRHA